MFLNLCLMLTLDGGLVCLLDGGFGVFGCCFVWLFVDAYVWMWFKFGCCFCCVFDCLRLIVL